MLKNYFTTAINNLIKNKLYSAINIIGLAVGLTACILITLYVKDELSYDKQWEKADLIYRINTVESFGNSPANIYPSASILALPALKKYFPEDIGYGTRIQRTPGEIRIGDIRYTGSISLVDEDFINTFQVEVLKGSLKNTFQGPGNIALSEDSATQYFGDRDPIGEVIILKPDYGDEEQYKITAVYRFISPNTTLNIPNFSLLDESKIPVFMRSWNISSPETYIRFSETADIEKFVDRLPDFVDQIIPVDNSNPPPEGKKLSDVRGYSLQKISDIYFNPIDSSPDLQTRVGNKTVITVFIIISFLVLIIGCVNFIILSTAKATQRAREVAMRKVVGARFKQLLFQFLGESILISIISILLAVATIELVLPFFKLLINKELSVPYISPGSYIFVLLLLMFVGLLSGFYPALVLSRFSPARALKANQTTETHGSFKLRNALVIFQFTTSIILIIATIVAYYQLLYTSKHDPGFSPDNLLVVEDLYRPEIRSHRKTFQQELLKLPEVKNAGFSTLQPKLVGGGADLHFSFQRKMPGATSKLFNNIFVGYNFFKTYGISLLSGRFFSRDMDQEEPAPVFSPSQNGNEEEIKDKRIIINLAAARQLGYATADEAIGKILLSSDSLNSSSYSEYTIIGVVADSQFRNLRLKPEPEIYRLSSSTAFFLSVRYKGDYRTMVKEVRGVWNKVVGDVSFRCSNVRQNLATTFLQEEQENRILIAFALLAVFIACMGLFGMASFTVDRRVKEIGLRRVMGAKVKDIVKLLGWNLLKPVLIANVIAWPIAIFAMQRWLERFPYRFNPLLLIPICLGSGLIALAIAWFTVAGNTTRAAKKNPIHSLRYE